LVIGGYFFLNRSDTTDSSGSCRTCSGTSYASACSGSIINKEHEKARISGPF
jgi:hypothetical protein